MRKVEILPLLRSVQKERGVLRGSDSNEEWTFFSGSSFELYFIFERLYATCPILSGIFTEFLMDLLPVLLPYG